MDCNQMPMMSYQPNQPIFQDPCNSAYRLSQLASFDTMYKQTFISGIAYSAMMNTYISTMRIHQQFLEFYRNTSTLGSNEDYATVPEIYQDYDIVDSEGRLYGCYMPEGRRQGWYLSRMNLTDENEGKGEMRLDELKRIAVANRRRMVIRNNRIRNDFSNNVQKIRDSPPHFCLDSYINST
ncbi:uncharacterized protein L201_005028 [Kwoniella dendrophila CBS 6074]|uniref:Uncharacterized protein n=1 Tax=Kwoniella dendrophila CBS 6074 TaxID=1295534 RepID=A0AAX4JZT5_9TREE